MGTGLPYYYPQAGPFWVSPSGNDSTGDGSQGNPWATPQKAQTFIRTNNLNKVLLADMIVNLRAGTYPMSATWTLTDADSGSNGFKVRYVSYDGAGLAKLFCGTQITNWTLVSGSIYKASVPNTFWTMYENDIRSISAREPKLSNAGFPCSRAPYFTTLTGNGQVLGSFKYDSGDFNPAGWSTSDLQSVMWPGGTRNWLTDTQPVVGVNTGTQVITLTNQAKFDTFLSGGSRYFVQGVQAMLTNPGEFYLDRGGGMLYYYARDGAIGSQVITVPGLVEAIQVFGTSQTQPAMGLSFEGIDVSCTDYLQWYTSGWPYDDQTTTQYGPVPEPHPADPSYNYFAAQPQFKLGAVHFRNCTGVSFVNGHIHGIGTSGVFMDGLSVGNFVTASWIEKCGITGMRLDGRYPLYGDVVNGNQLTNLRVNNFGELALGSSGVEFANSGGNLLQYADIFGGPRKAIWIFADSDVLPTSGIYARNNVVDHVKAYLVCQDSGDTGAITCSSLSSKAVPYIQNTFSQIIVDQIQAQSSMNGIVPDGMFMDDETDGQIMTNCQVTNVTGGGAQFRQNNSSGHVLTNTSFLSDGTANPGFNPALMDTANIGTTSGFPYP